MNNVDLGLFALPGDQGETDESGDPALAGVIDQSADANSPASDAGQAEVTVAEIPDADDLTLLIWTARCTFPPHGVLGTFESKELAEQAKVSHLLVKHGRRE
jgi:hypothetical protein